MNTAGAELIEEIARAFSSAAPHGWARIRVEVLSITEVTGFTAVATMGDGSSESFYIADDKTEEDTLDKVESLRRTMAEQNGDLGAWFTMTLDIDAAGEFSASFDYDNKPLFDFKISEESLRDDLQAFPRSPEFYPEWISLPSLWGRVRAFSDATKLVRRCAVQSQQAARLGSEM